MVCDPCCCFLLLCILIVQLYEVFGPRNLGHTSGSNGPANSMPYNEEEFRESQGFSKEYMTKAHTCSAKCMNRVTELGCSKKVRAAMECSNGCVMRNTKPEDYQCN